MAFAGVAATAGYAGAAPKITLKFGHTEPEQSVWHTGALKFKEEVERLSNGEIEIAIYPNGQLGSLRDLLEGVQMGTVDFTATVSAVVANFCPELSVFDLPCLIQDYPHAYRCLDGDVGDFLKEKLRAQGLIPLAWWQIGFRNLTSNKDIRTIDDLKGQRIRIMPSNIFRDIFLQLGADPVPMDIGELFTGLQQGTVDGQENPYTQIRDSKFYEVQKYLVETMHAYSPGVFSMSPQAWNKLTPEQREIILEATKPATVAARKANEDWVEAAKKELIEEHGMQFRELDRKALEAKLRPVYAKYPNLAKLVEMCDAHRQ